MSEIGEAFHKAAVFTDMLDEVENCVDPRASNIAYIRQGFVGGWNAHRERTDALRQAASDLVARIDQLYRDGYGFIYGKDDPMKEVEALRSALNTPDDGGEKPLYSFILAKGCQVHPTGKTCLSVSKQPRNVSWRWKYSQERTMTQLDKQRTIDYLSDFRNKLMALVINDNPLPDETDLLTAIIATIETGLLDVTVNPFGEKQNEQRTN